MLSFIYYSANMFVVWIFIATDVTIIQPRSYVVSVCFNTLRPRQNGHHFPDDIFKCIFLNENVILSIEISLKFVPKGPINNMSALVQIMAWHRLGYKPLSEPMLVSLPTHTCVTRPQWVNSHRKLARGIIHVNKTAINRHLHVQVFFVFKGGPSQYKDVVLPV